MLRQREVPDGLQPVVMRAESWNGNLVHTARPVSLQCQRAPYQK
jgi:hypothetical protein